MGAAKEFLIAATVCLAALAAVAVPVSLIQRQVDANFAAHEQRWEGAVLVKICPSGTYIYRLTTGEHSTGGGFPQRVESPNTICDMGVNIVR